MAAHTVEVESNSRREVVPAVQLGICTKELATPQVGSYFSGKGIELTAMGGELVSMWTNGCGKD